MFRTSPVHHQERFVQAVFADFGMWYYCAYYSTRPAVTKFTSLCGATAQNGPRPSRIFDVSKSHTIRNTQTHTHTHTHTHAR